MLLRSFWFISSWPPFIGGVNKIRRPSLIRKGSKVKPFRELWPLTTLEGRSQTTFTIFVFIWPPTSLRLHYLWYKSLQKSGFLTTYPPPLVNVVCERITWHSQNWGCSRTRSNLRIDIRSFDDNTATTWCSTYQLSMHRAELAKEWVLKSQTTFSQILHISPKLDNIIQPCHLL